jgi:GT2 family glycosyltransferase
MNYPKVTIGLVLHKNEKYLKPCLKSLVEQTYPNIEFLFRDQSENGEIYGIIRREMPLIFQKVKIEKGANLWHSGGHNALIRRMTGEYYIAASCDMFYPPDFVSGMIEEVEKKENQDAGFATCKVMAWDFKNMNLTNFIDSCGIGITKSHYFYDAGQGEEDQGQYDNRKYIFGASGALTLFKKKALDDIAFKNNRGLMEYYDSLLHHKNDVDISYRLQWAGYKCLFIPHVKVWHDRQVAAAKKGEKRVNIIKSRSEKDRWVKEDSFFGQQVVLFKHFDPHYSLPVRLNTTLFQWLSLGYRTIFEPYTLKTFKTLKNFEMDILKKQKFMKVRVKPEEIEKLMS